MLVITKPGAAVVLLSGDLNSATVLAMTVDSGYDSHRLSFSYGQRQGAGLDASANVAKSLGAASHHVANIDNGVLGASALTDDAIEVSTGRIEDGIPVPARNTVFLAYALGSAEVREASHIFIGVNAVDYIGCPDCRPEYITQRALYRNARGCLAADRRDAPHRHPALCHHRSVLARDAPCAARGRADGRSQRRS